MSNRFTKDLTPEQRTAHINLMVDLMFDIDKRREAWAQVRAGTATPEVINALEDGYEDAWFEGRWVDGFLEESADWTHEIARSTPAPAGSGGRAAGSMSQYWRWALFEDCMADVPSQVERCLQALVGAQFDLGRKNDGEK